MMRRRRTTTRTRIKGSHCLQRFWLSIMDALDTIGLSDSRLYLAALRRVSDQILLDLKKGAPLLDLDTFEHDMAHTRWPVWHRSIWPPGSRNTSDWVAPSVQECYLYKIEENRNFLIVPSRRDRLPEWYVGPVSGLQAMVFASLTMMSWNGHAGPYQLTANENCWLATKLSARYYKKIIAC